MRGVSFKNDLYRLRCSRRPGPGALVHLRACVSVIVTRGNAHCQCQCQSLRAGDLLPLLAWVNIDRPWTSTLKGLLGLAQLILSQRQTPRTR